MQKKEYRKGAYRISTSRSELDIHFIHSYLTRSYWSHGIPYDIVEKCIRHSLCFGLFLDKKQVGFARLITDYTTYGYLADVFVIEEHQGKGLGKWLVECITTEPELQSLRRWGLATKDTHSLYQRYGFRRLENPDMFMEIHNPDIYRKRNG